MNWRALMLRGLIAAIAMGSLTITARAMRLYGEHAYVAILTTGIWASQHSQENG